MAVTFSLALKYDLFLEQVQSEGSLSTPGILSLVTMDGLYSMPAAMYTPVRFFSRESILRFNQIVKEVHDPS